MRTIQLLHVSTAIALALSSSPSHAVEPSPARIRQALKKCVDQQQRAPGIVVGLIDEDGTNVYAYGKRERGKPQEVDGDTLFEIASITKTFTATLLQQMADAGELKLEDPIEQFLPSTVKCPVYKGRHITLYDLATHTSGLPSMPDNLTPKDGDDPWADYTVDQMYAFLSEFKPTRKIGGKMEYSNFGMGLLGHILALKAGTNYESLVVSRICEPLKMKSTRIVLTPGLRSHLAVGHSIVGPPVKYWGSLALLGDGALFSSVNDMLKYLAANMGHGPAALTNAMAKTHVPQKRMGIGFKVCLGWMDYSLLGVHYTWHNGGTGGFRSFIAFDREKKRGVIVLANEANDVDDIGRFLLFPDTYEDIDDFKAPKLRKVAAIDHKLYEGYVGRYEFGQKHWMTITRDGDRLIGCESGDIEFPCELFPESETEFFFTADNSQVSFVRDNSGQVNALILHEDGKSKKAVKIRPQSE